MQSEPLLSLSGVSAYYGNLCAVRDIAFQARAGETIAIIGPNGAGKTSLLRAISGVMDRVRGTIRFDGADISRRSPQQRVGLGLAHVPEGRHIFTAMTVEENIRIGGFLRRDADRQASFDEALAMFPRLTERRHQLAGTLSGGEQQMLAMARALMARPKVLMLDEPSMGLAPLVVNEIYRQIRLLRQRGVTILLVEQNARLALENSDRALILATGTLRHEGLSTSVAHDRSLGSLLFGT
ncbi:MAG: ABC transporter ATP-binding protein [Burkholderiales bacterium]|nr:ABC transporter ATP-binding protein [Burkholderiales bacterium]OJX06705.1 MAG: ABC transporter ATP-binding protein [Burkholderiales bacterium 70-64]